MAMLEHPVDVALMDLDRAIRESLSIFMEDNHLSERERRVYDTLNIAHRKFSMDRNIGRAHEYYRRNYDDPSAYGLEKLEAAGLVPISIEDRRRVRKIVNLSDHRQNSAG